MGLLDGKRPLQPFAGAVWRWLTVPDRSVLPDSADYLNARLVMILLVTTVPIGIALGALPIIFSAGATSLNFFTGLLGLVFFATAHQMARHGRYQSATWVVTLAAVISIVGMILVGMHFDTIKEPPDKYLKDLDFLIMPLLLSCLLMAWRGLIWLAVFNLIVVLVLPFVVPANMPFNVARYFIFMLVGGVMTLMLRGHFEALERIRMRALRHSEVRYKGLFENAPVALWEEDYSSVKQCVDDIRAAGVTDLMAYFDQHPAAVKDCASQVRIIGVNQAAIKLLGADVVPDFSNGLAGLLDEDALNTFKYEICALARGETHFQTEAFRLNQMGDSLIISLHLAVAPGSEATWDRVLISVLDITEHKQAEQRRVDLAIEQERVDVLHQFIADISHDLRTPLTTVKTYLYLLAKVDDPQKRDRAMTILEAQAQRMENLLNDMLTAARQDHARSLKSRSFDLNWLVEHVLAGQDTLIQQKQQRIEFKPAASTLYLAGDTDRLTHAIEHMLTNAINYTPAGGLITVRTHQTEAEITLEVQDAGDGISEDVLPHIFKPFFRGDMSRSTATGGAGLGLTIAKSIVEAHHGRIEVKNLDEVGCLFSVILPVNGLPVD